MATIIRLARALDVLDALKERGDMTIALARTFLAVAEEEGVTGKDLENRLGMSQGSVSRHLLDLGQRNRGRVDRALLNPSSLVNNEIDNWMGLNCPDTLEKLRSY